MYLSDFDTTDYYTKGQILDIIGKDKTYKLQKLREKWGFPNPVNVRVEKRHNSKPLHSYYRKDLVDKWVMENQEKLRDMRFKTRKTD